MDIKSLKDLDALLKLCRRRGVTEIDLGMVKFKLGDLPQEEHQSPREQGRPERDPSDPWKGFPDGLLTPEQLAFYSAGGLPEDDPLLKDNAQ